MPRISQTTEITEYDGTTGEVTKQTATKITNWGTEPDYVKLYLQDILYLSDMPTQYSGALTALMKRVTYAGDEHGMCLILAPMIRDDICKELGLKNRQSLSNILRKLVQGEILFSVGRNVYRLNPYLFGRGTWADIAQIRMEVNYVPGQGRTFQSVIEHKQQQKADIKANHAIAAQQSPQNGQEGQGAAQDTQDTQDTQEPPEGLPEPPEGLPEPPEGPPTDFEGMSAADVMGESA